MERHNRLIHGDCNPIMAAEPDNSIDLVVTDPPYLVNYRDRQGRSIENDRDDDWIEPAFRNIYRLLKPDSFCISFYGWNNVEKFMTSWKTVGFRPVGHIVWTKPYSSKQGYLAYRHESAYLLAKGRPAYRDTVMRDVLPWEYTGNALHPTQKPLASIMTLIENFSRPGDLVLDPFAGSGTTAVAAALTGRTYLAIEKDVTYFNTAWQRLYAGEEKEAA